MPPVTEEHVYTDHVHPWEEIVYYVSKYGTIENYLMKEKLVFPEQPPAILILPNDFPYSVDPGIEHILIWSKEPLEADFVESLLEKHYGSHVWEWVYFVNPPALQSVRKLPHVHVFMRKKTEIK
ncbi:uncharacterized protein B0P05DRAFT_580243 [Gilbertella persicaria]|uniref:uncharacterized protein n=1 Tax=Gilbertella persicaria TaxID=101096 RepID=UPI00221EFF52|nr:uncharacterized protein B0P05DRAFT_580243 [Gilbertella persicaria]KAI8073472.1 hypothetical protein B0P05DRAFT_580243 [Gilbertella persicaria]